MARHPTRGWVREWTTSGRAAGLPGDMGELLVSQALVDRSGQAGVRFDEIGPVELKGISESLRLHIASRVA